MFSESLDFKKSQIPPNNDLKFRFQRYSKIKATKWGWILSQLEIDYDQIEPAGILSSYQNEIPKPIPVSIVVPPSVDERQFKVFLSSIERELIVVHDQRLGELKTETLDVCIPLEALKKLSAKEMIKSFDFLVERMATNRILPQKAYFEIPGFEPDLERLKLVLKVIAKHNEIIKGKSLDYYSESGFKLAITNPKNNKDVLLKYVTAAIVFTRDLGLELKIAGENFSHRTTVNEQTEEVKIGFLNLFTACMLSYSCDLKASEVLEILGDTNPENFELTDNSLQWKDFSVSATEIKMLRRVVFPSFSSTDLKTSIEGIARLSK